MEKINANDLKTEYLTNPIGIDITSPRFFWTVENAKTQSAYELEVTDDNGNLRWNSGKVESSKMTGIKYLGQELKSRDSLIWKVRLWDQDGNPGDWSENASFELGLLNKSDWKASWITGNYSVNKKERYPVDCFKKSIEIQSDKKIKKARAYMSACGIYEGYINKQKIGKFFLAPGITDYRKRVQCQAVDITDMLKPGNNELSFMLADGWYRGSVGAWGLKNYYGAETKFIAQLEITYEDGSTETIVTDDSFDWTPDGPIRQADNKDGEIYDARREDFSKATWSKAKLSNHNITPGASNNFDLIEQERFVNPKLLTSPSGKLILDFGQNIAGTFEFHINAHEGDKLFLRFGEKILPDGEFTQHNIQCVNKKITTPLQQIDYTCKDGMNDYKMRFGIFGYQYVEITESDVEIHPEDFVAIAAYSDFETTINFDSSNQFLNKFVENTLWSLKNNSADLPTDCPTRERHGWTGDAQLFLNTATYMVNYSPFAKKFENDLCDWQTKDGKFPQIAPEGGTDFYMRPMNGSVGWADAGVFIPYRLWKKYGDISFIEEYYEPMRKFAIFEIGRCNKTQPFISEKTGIKGKDKKYLYNYGQHYGEWAEPAEVHQMTFKDFASANPEVATAYCSYLMTVMTEIAETLDHKEDAKLFSEYAEGCRRTYQHMRDNEINTLDTDRQAKLVRPLYFNLLNDVQTDFAKKRLIKAMDNYNWRVGTGFLSTPFILYVLQNIDISYAYKLLENEEKPGWLFMVKSGATTIWEDWEGPASDNGKGGGVASLNHYSKGAVCEWVFEEMCGIKVHGENHFIIAPNPGGSFEFAGADYDSIFGRVGCHWEKNGDKYSYKISIPANTSAEVVLLDGRKETLGAGVYSF